MTRQCATGVSVGTVAGDLSNRSEMNSSPPVIIGTDGKSRPAHVTTTTRTTESTKVEHDVDLETGEITSPGSRAPLQDSAPGVEQLSAEPGALDPIAAAKAEAATVGRPESSLSV